MIAFLELAYWLQLTERIGPVIISISRVMNDIFTISINYLLILVTFSMCIFYVSRVQTLNFNKFHVSFKYFIYLQIYTTTFLHFQTSFALTGTLDHWDESCSVSFSKVTFFQVFSKMPISFFSNSYLCQLSFCSKFGQFLLPIGICP